MENLWRDLRYGARQLRRAPGPTLAIAVSLGLAIGANTTIFTLVNAVFLHPLAVSDPDRLVSVYRTFQQAADTSSGAFAGGLLPTSYPNYEDFRDRSRSFAGLAAYGFGAFNLAGGGEPEQVFGEFVTSDYFALLGLEPAAGRFFAAEEDRTRGTHPVAVLSYGLWQRRFASDAGLVGREIRLNGRSFTVVGVAPRGFGGLQTLGAPQLWVPAAMYADLNSGLFAQALDRRDLRLFNVFGRLAPGVTREQAAADLAAVAAGLAETYPEVNRNRGVRVLGLAESAINPNQRHLFVRSGAVLMAAVGLVLAIACANVANLLLARARRRAGEIALRLALGAGRRLLVRQMLTESLLLAFLGGACGWLLAVWGRDLLWSLRPPFLADADLDLALDGRVLAFTLAVTLVTGLLFGLAPALGAARADLGAALPGRGEPGLRRRRGPGLRQVLVAAQVALSLVALVAAGMFLQSLGNARQVDLGFESQRLLVLGLNPAAQGADVAEGRRFYEQLLERVAALPGLRAASVASNAPLGFSPQWRMLIPGAEELTGAEGMYISVNTVSPGYFETLGVPLLEGRPFGPEDGPEGRPVVIVNRAFAERFWPGETAVGKQIRWAVPDLAPFTIVGVAADLKYATLGEGPTPYFYRPLAQEEASFATLHVRTAGEPAALLPAVQRQVRELDPGLPIVNPQVVSDLVRQALWAPVMGASLLAAFGLIALLLAATGIYAVLAQLVQQRRREVGVRVALGARPGQVLALVLRQGLVQVAVGVGLGGLAAIAAGRLAAGLLYGLAGAEPGVLALATALLAAVALVACLLPALRAVRLDPVATLRQT